MRRVPDQYTIDFDPDDVMPIEAFTPETAHGLLKRFEELGPENAPPLLFGEDPRFPQLAAISIQRFDAVEEAWHIMDSWIDPAKADAVTPQEFTDRGMDFDDLFYDPDQAPEPEPYKKVEEVDDPGDFHLIHRDFEPSMAHQLLRGPVDPTWPDFGPAVFALSEEDRTARLVVLYVEEYQALVHFLEKVQFFQRAKRAEDDAEAIAAGTFDWSQVIHDDDLRRHDD